MSGRGSGPTTDRYRKSGCGFLREISVEAPPQGPSPSANKTIAPQAQSKFLPHGALIEIGNAPATVSGFEDAARAKDGRRSISHLRRQVARHFHPSANFTNFRGRPCHGVVSFYGSASSSSPGSQELNVSYHGARTTVKRLLSGRSRNFHNFAHVPTRG
jgi:hypothetical protein